MGASLALVLGLAACGGESAADGPATAECPDGVVTLSVLRAENQVPNDQQLDDYSESVDGCVTFDVQELPFSQLAEKISILAPTDSAPDIVGYDSPDTADYASKGVLMALDEYVPDGWRDDVLPATLQELSYEDKVYSLGVQQDVLTVYFNKDMTDKAGLTIPTSVQDAWTWAEAKAAMLACQQANPGVMGLAPTQLGDGTPGTVYGDLPMIRSNGDPDADPSSTEYKTFYALSDDGKTADGWLNTPEAVEAATFFQGLYNGDEAVSSKTGRPQAFIDGQACFDIFVGEQALNLKEAGVPFAWGKAPLPYLKTPIVHTGALTVGVLAKTQHPEEAAKAVVGMSTSPQVNTYNETAIRLPTLRSVQQAIPMFQEPPFDMEYEQLSEWGKPRPVTTAFGQYNVVVAKALKDIAYGSDPQDRLDQAVDELEPILSRTR